MQAFIHKFVPGGSSIFVGECGTSLQTQPKNFFYYPSWDRGPFNTPPNIISPYKKHRSFVMIATLTVTHRSWGWVLQMLISIPHL